MECYPVRIFPPCDQWNATLWEYSLLVTASENIPSLCPMECYPVRICPPCDQWNATQWAYSLLVSNGMLPSENIPSFWPMECYPVRIFLPCDQWNATQWKYSLLVSNGQLEYSFIVTNGMLPSENIPSLCPMECYPVGIFPPCVPWNVIQWGTVYSLLRDHSIGMPDRTCALGQCCCALVK
jgi:hypothetical protein